MSKKKYIFTLRGINFERVNMKYGITPVTSLAEDEVIPENATKIDDLELIRKPVDMVTFLDESKRLRKCLVSMIDYQSKKEVQKGRYKCFWDRNLIPDHIHPIGCPINYVPCQAVKCYHSVLTKETYTIREKVTKTKAKQIEDTKDTRYIVDNKDYYQSDGIFCSFNCCLAYIQSAENKNNPLYKNSESLLLKIYNELNDGQDIELIPAPHWRTLTDFGGTLTIDKFRESFNKVQYNDHGFFFTSLGYLYEDQIKF